MRHDESSKRPRVDPAQNPRLAAALSRLSQGVHDARDAPSQRSESAAPILPPLSDPSAGADLYIPGDDDVELLDQEDLEAGAADGGGGGDEEEIIPSDAEMQLTDLPAGNGLSASDADEEITPTEGEVQLLDDAPEGDSAGHAGAVDDGGLFDAGGELTGELIVEPWADQPSEARVSLPPSIPPGARSRRPPPPADPLDSSDSLEAPDAASDAAPDGDSPWAAAAGDAAIDASALPSAHSPVAAPAPKPPPPAPAEASGGSRSWVTLFLVIALVASGTTFLVLRFNVGQKPQDAPGTGPPIQVAAPTAAPQPLVTAPPEVPSAPIDLDPAPAASTAAVAPLEPTAAVSAEPTTAPALSAAAPTAAVTTSPAGPATGPQKIPVGPKPSGTPTQSSKKPGRIF